MTPQEQDLIRKRQRSRSIVTGLLLGALAILFFAITIAKLVGPEG
jgi:hypothetical protein